MDVRECEKELNGCRENEGKCVCVFVSIHDFSKFLYLSIMILSSLLHIFFFYYFSFFFSSLTKFLSYRLIFSL